MAKAASVSPFLGAVSARSPAGFGAAIFGAPHGTPYISIDNGIHAGAPDAFRNAVARDYDWIDHWDFDFGGPLLTERGFKVADLGNLRTTPKDGLRNRKLIEAKTREIIEAGAVPIMFGGDDSTPVPFIAAFSGSPPITILQIDAHIDWRDQREGETQGFSSTMRRASEHEHVWRIVQAGIRGMGSARAPEIAAAQQWGAHLITAHEIHRSGIETVVALIPEDAPCLITFDCDALDSSQMPAVSYPSPGGLTFTQIVSLIAGVAAKAPIAGFTMVEFVPKRDRDGTAAFTAARIACNVIGRIARQR
ncbi:MAG: arginase family protein [Aestuariivirga sp.]